MLYAVDSIGGTWDFVTLTAHEKTRSTSASWANVARGWNRLNLRLKRAKGRFYYVRVYEMTKKGSFHIHMLVSVRMPNKWWKDNARACGMGHQAKKKPLESNAQAVFYVAKYMTKEPDGFPRNVRRITCSRNFPDKMQDKKHDWACIGNEVLMSDIVHWTENLTLTAVDYDTGQTITTDDYLVDNFFNPG
jgi:hypothetical protein